MRQKMAVFDIDGTVFRSSLLIELVERLIEEGIMPEEAKQSYAREYNAWLNRDCSYERYIDAVIRTYMEHIKGIHYADFARVGDLVISEHQFHTYRYTRDLITDLKRNGYFLVAISQSPKTVLDKFCKNLGFDKVYGRFYEIGPNDCFTGVVADEHLIANKANIVKRVVEKENLTFDGSIAVGDTEGDITMLELVERPICFNPNMQLYRHARLNDWQIVVERKDVIYDLQDLEHGLVASASHLSN